MHILETIYTYLRNRRELRLLRKVKSQAIFLAEKNNTRYYVLTDWNNKPRAMTRDKIKWLKKRGIFGKNVNIYHLEREALFIADPPVVKRKEKILN